jgi:Protein of unknown function (DUF1569)
MKNLFEPSDLESLTTRIAQLRPDSARQWGKLTVSQVLAHCTLGVQTATGELQPPRKLIGRLIGPVIKPKVLGDDEPMRRNSPTVPETIVPIEPDFATEQLRLIATLERFSATGPSGCTSHPHAFFGRLKPDEWAILVYKHVDHHLRQFGV